MDIFRKAKRRLAVAGVDRAQAGVPGRRFLGLRMLVGVLVEGVGASANRE